MKNRKETIHDLDDISEMTDHEITINADFIRQTAQGAISHIKEASKLVFENHRQKTHIRQLQMQIEKLKGRLSDENQVW